METIKLKNPIRHQGATNHARNVQMYANKIVAYDTFVSESRTKFRTPIQNAFTFFRLL